MSLLLLLACSPTPTLVPGDPVEGLEAAAVATEACADGMCGDEPLATGALAVSGAASDPTLTIDGVDIALHSPTAAPLAELAGRVVTATVRADWMLPASLELVDDAGLLHVVETGAGDAFGHFELSAGEALGEVMTDDDYLLTFHSVILETDDGPVELVAGDVVGVTVGGVSWRFALVTAYSVDTVPGGEYADCGGRLPMLSYEATRVDAPVSPVRLLRPEGLELAAHSGCGG